MFRLLSKLVPLLTLLPGAAVALKAGGHGDPVASVALALTLILVAAKLAGELAVRLGQSAVLGELVVGVLLGNLKSTRAAARNRSSAPDCSDPS